MYVFIIPCLAAFNTKLYHKTLVSCIISDFANLVLKWWVCYRFPVASSNVWLFKDSLGWSALLVDTWDQQVHRFNSTNTLSDREDLRNVARLTERSHASRRQLSFRHVDCNWEADCRQLHAVSSLPSLSGPNGLRLPPHRDCGVKNVFCHALSSPMHLGCHHRHQHFRDN